MDKRCGEELSSVDKTQKLLSAPDETDKDPRNVVCLRLPPVSLPWLNAYFKHRDGPFKSGSMWLQDKREADGAEGLWRVHDELYDLTDWIHRHPGGSDWLILTKGTDITEAFECHHIFDTAENILKTFHIRSAKTRRNSPFTFKQDGFFRTLKKRVAENLKGTNISGGTVFSKMLADTLMVTTLTLSVLAATKMSFLIGTLAGFFLAFTLTCSHNFIHQKNNFRMYYTDLSLVSSRDYRVTHVLSHHLFANTIIDMELSLLEPGFQYLPWEGKSWWARFGPWIYSPIWYCFLLHIGFVNRILDSLLGSKTKLCKAELVALVVPAVMIIFGKVSLVNAFIMWIWEVAMSSFLYHAIGINAAHHHPDIFHEGDVPRKDLDWGLQVLDAVRDRPIISGSNLLALTFFGHHGLHHIFPTVDHVRLTNLYPVFQKTCEEFGMNYEPYSQTELIIGQFQQVARNKPHLIAASKKD